MKKLAVFRKNNKQREQKKIKKSLKIAKMKQKVESYIILLEKALRNADFAPIFKQAISLASAYQIAKLTNQANALLKYYQLLLENVDLQKHFLYETVSKEVPFTISSITIKRWV